MITLLILLMALVLFVTWDTDSEPPTGGLRDQ